MGQSSTPGATLREIPHYQTAFAYPLRAQGARDTFVDDWFDLMAGAAPNMPSLAEHGEDLDRMFGVEPSDGRYKREHNMLTIALTSGNLEGTVALLEAGADPNLAGAAFASAALPTTHPERGGPPDWSTSPRFLDAYLRHGGHPNYPTERDPFPMLTRTAQAGNYEGFHHLLEAGADPWIEVRGLTPDQPPTGEDRYAFPRSMGGSDAAMAHILRFFLAGNMDGAPEPMAALVYDNLLFGIDEIAAGQTMLDLSQIVVLRDILARSLATGSAYRRAERERAVAGLTSAIDAENARP